MMTSQQAPALELADIEKSYGTTRALRGVTFSVMPGEVRALMGKNGAGKSTLVRISAEWSRLMRGVSA